MKNLKPEFLVKRMLSDKKVRELKPKEVSDIKNFVDASDFEKTITGNTRLSVIYEIWEHEKAKRKRKTREMKKAEKVLDAEARLMIDEIKRRKDYERGGGEIRKKKSGWKLKSSHTSMNPLSGLRKNLKKLGITKEKTINKILDTLKKVKGLTCQIDAIEELDKRVKEVLEAFRGMINKAREIFSKQPMLLAKPDKQFNDIIKAVKLDIAHKNMKPEGTM